MEEAKKEEETSQNDFISLFVKYWKQNSNGRPLAAIFATQQMKGKVSTQSSDSEVEAAIRAEVQSAVDNSFNVVRNRIAREVLTLSSGRPTTHRRSPHCWLS